MNFKVVISAILASTIAVVGCDSSSNGGAAGSGGTAGGGGAGSGGTAGGGGEGGAGGAPSARDCDNLPDLSAYSIVGAPATDAPCTTTFNDTSAMAGENLQLAIDDASSGDVICIAPGTYNINQQIGISRVPLTLQGTGTSPDDVVLNFGGPGSMGGIFIDQGDVTVENFWIKNTPANAIQNKGDDSVLRKLHVSWDNEDPTDNGLYGIYPTEATNTLLEYCQMSGAKDAGIYVGKYVTGVVKNNLVHDNVLGLEVENSDQVEVFHNEMVNNTAGLLALQQPLSETLRIANTNIEFYENDVWCNNGENFATGGGIIPLIPVGTGLVLYAGNQIDIHDNNIELNDTVGAGIISNTLICQLTGNDCPGGYPVGYNPYPQNIYVYDNTYAGNGTMADPNSPFGQLFAGIGFGTPESPTPDVVWDGYIEPDYTGTNLCIGSTNQPSFLDFTQNKCTETMQGDVMAFGVCAFINKTEDTTAVTCDLPN